jgi:SAM-dependent methyltransferase
VERWDAKWRAAGDRAARAGPSEALTALDSLLPRSGRALDVACGAGRNALHLAARGLAVTGVDVSPEGLAIARREAERRALVLDLVEADLRTWRPPAASFDLVVVIDFLDRALFLALEAALRPGGLLVYETATRAQLAFPEAHPRRPEFLLEDNELLRAFPRLTVLRYDEGPRALADGSRAVRARLLARSGPVVGGG